MYHGISDSWKVNAVCGMVFSTEDIVLVVLVLSNEWTIHNGSPYITAVRWAIESSGRSERLG